MALGKILVVDDEEKTLNLLEIELSQEGYDVVKAANGQQALQAAKGAAPGLILIDLVLPDMNGAEVVKELLQDSATANIPVIFLTGAISPEEAEKELVGISVDGRRFETLAKPFKFQEVLNKVKNTLEH